MFPAPGDRFNMSAERPFFHLGSVGARASWISVVILMFFSPAIALSIFMGIVYAVVPLSIWGKELSLRWRIPVGVTLFLGYGWMLAGVILDLQSNVSYSLFPGGVTLFSTLTAGFVFLPLAAAGSISTLLKKIRSQKEAEVERLESSGEQRKNS